MSLRPPKIPAVFYRAPQGNEPVREWLKELPKQDRHRIGTDIRTVEYGWPVGMPTCRPLKGGLCEVRTNLRNTTARVIFCIAGGRMVLLHGFIKKSRETPEDDLRLARRRKSDIEKEMRGRTRR